MANETNMKNYKEMTTAIRDLLIKAANEKIKSKREVISINWINEGYDKDYSKFVAKTMCDAYLFSGDATPMVKLTDMGFSLAQDISNSEIWDKAVAYCDERQLYSFRTVATKAVNLINAMLDENGGNN